MPGRGLWDAVKAAGCARLPGLGTGRRSWRHQGARFGEGRQAQAANGPRLPTRRLDVPVSLPALPSLVPRLPTTATTGSGEREREGEREWEREGKRERERDEGDRS